MEKLFDVAYTICDISGWALTHLQLQKMLYITQMLYIGTHNGDPLFNGRFEAWQYGPVEPILYNKLCGFGSETIPEWALSDYKSVSEEKYNIIKVITDLLNTKTTKFLVDYTHN